MWRLCAHTAEDGRYILTQTKVQPRNRFGTLASRQNLDHAFVLSFLHEAPKALSSIKLEACHGAVD